MQIRLPCVFLITSWKPESKGPIKNTALMTHKQGGPIIIDSTLWVWTTSVGSPSKPPDNQAYIGNWWVWPYKNIILTISAHFFGKILSPSIIIIPDHHILGGKRISIFKNGICGIHASSNKLLNPMRTKECSDRQTELWMDGDFPAYLNHFKKLKHGEIWAII